MSTSSSIPSDVQEFLQGYPSQSTAQKTSTADKNLQFLRGKGKCKPYDITINVIHDKRGDYATLEREHGFIQWIFPIREHGVNFEAQPLNQHEIEQLQDDEVAHENILKSYEMMLDFYGMKLLDRKTGELGRSAIYLERYRNLTSRSHNFLRISRLLKSLGELSLDYLAAPFLLFILSEQSEHGHLNSPGLKSSMDRWWVNCQRDDADRKAINNLIAAVRLGEHSYTTAAYRATIQKRQADGELLPWPAVDGAAAEEDQTADA